MGSDDQSFFQAGIPSQKPLFFKALFKAIFD